MAKIAMENMIDDTIGDAWGNSSGEIDLLGAGADGGMSLDSILAKPDALKSAGGFDMGNMFKPDKISGTLQGIGAIAEAAAGIYDAHNKKKYRDKVFGMEEKRVARETQRQDKQQLNYEKVFG